MINVSPIGRNATNEERATFEKYDKEHKIRETFVKALKEKFADESLTFSIGGQISFDVFPTGWDKTFALNHIKDDGWREIHFFGDKTYKVRKCLQRLHQINSVLMETLYLRAGTTMKSSVILERLDTVSLVPKTPSRS